MIPKSVYNRIKSCISDLNLNASPGYPWCFWALDKRNLIDRIGEDALINLVWERLKALDSMELSGYTAAGAVKNNCTDPIRLFVKNELHSREKVLQGRMRLIMSVSVVDELVERFLCTDQNHMEIDEWANIPSKPGMGLDDESLKVLIGNLSEFNVPVQTDVSGFDWSVKGWMLQLDAEARILLSRSASESRYARLMRNRVRCLSQAVLVLSDGSVFVQVKPGIQKSGSYNTSSTNSRVRWMLAQFVGAGRAMVMGDDAVEEYAAGAQEKYVAFGLRLKEYKLTSLEEGIEFCAVSFGHDVQMCHPVKWAKMLANLLVKKPATELDELQLLTQFNYEMRHSPHLEFARAVIVLSGWGRAQRKDGES